MKKIMIYALLSLLGLNFQSCGGQIPNNKKDKDMTNGYTWGPAASAPLMFHADSRYVIFYVGEDNAPYPVIYSSLGGGIANGSSNAALNAFDTQMAMPNGFQTIWLSFAERKVYRGDFAFTEEQKERYKQLFVQGFETTEKKNDSIELVHETYTTFCVTFIPGGRALLHITGPGRRVYVDSFQCEELKDITLEELNFPYETKCNSLQEYFDKALKYEEFHLMLAYIKEHGIPFKLWDRYLERFNYKIKVEFENEETVIDPDYGYYFTNGEMFGSMDNVKVDAYARPMSLHMAWSVTDTVYTGHFYFNEEDVLNIFDEAYGKDRTQHGEFIIRVSKYNNWFDIVLRVGENEYKFDTEKRTQIHVFKVTPENKNYDDHLFYWNYRGQYLKKFIGE